MILVFCVLIVCYVFFFVVVLLFIMLELNFYLMLVLNIVFVIVKLNFLLNFFVCSWRMREIRCEVMIIL